MYMQDIHNELMAYYHGTYGRRDDKLYYIEDIPMPEGDGYDDSEERTIFNNDGGHDVMSSMHLFNAYVLELPHNDSRAASGNSMEMSMGDIDFSFPNPGLVNVPAMYNIDRKPVQFNTTRYVARRVQRQWRRALRYDSLNVCSPNTSLRGILESITGQACNELGTSVTNNTLYSLYFPQYFTVQHALLELSATVGTYALSPNWWVGQGKHGIIFGHNEHVCGTVSEDGQFKLAEGLEFLSESLNELIGDKYAA